MKCNCEVKLQSHNVAYNVNRNLFAISALAIEKYGVNGKFIILISKVHSHWYSNQTHVKLILGISIFPLLWI